jgi:hypothetical protein
MTRKEALNYAIKTISGVGGDEQAVKRLEEIMSELPICHWTRESILDACDQWIIDKGYMPTMSRLDQIPTLPSHTAIKTHFSMTYAEFLNKYFAKPNEVYIPQFGSRSTAEWLDLFRTEYLRIEPTSQVEFDNKRRDNVPCCATFVRRFSPDKKYSTLTAMLGLHTYEKKKKDKDVGKNEFRINLVFPSKK